MVQHCIFSHAHLNKYSINGKGVSVLELSYVSNDQFQQGQLTNLPISQHGEPRVRIKLLLESTKLLVLCPIVESRDEDNNHNSYKNSKSFDPSYVLRGGTQKN